MLAAIPFPSWIRPEIIPGLPFRWYGLMYVVAFGVCWLLFNYEARRRRSPWTEDDAAGFFFWAIVGLLIGARLFGTLVYSPEYYLPRPWFILWPFDEAGRFVGFQGMSYHGGFVGIIVATLFYCRTKKLSWLAWADIVAVSAPLGYTAGRIGNFTNGELWGKVSDKPWAMIFPNAERFSAKEAWVQKFADKVGIHVASMNDLVNLPRHPSQLYEAIFEGLFLWFVLWVIVRKRKVFEGFAVGCYAIGYGAIRFVIEYFREPDQGMGYILKLGDPTAPAWIYSTPWNFSMGQLLSTGMILIGVGVLVFGKGSARRAAVAEAAEAAARSHAKNDAKKLRKKLK